MSLESDFAAQIAPLLIARGRAQGQGVADRGAIWGGTLANLGQMIAGIPEQRMQAQLLQNRSQLTQLQMQEAAQNLQQQQQAQQFNTQANAALNDALMPQPDGSVTFDRAKLRQKLAQSGIPIDLQTHLFDSIDKADLSVQKANQAHADAMADVANGLKQSGVTTAEGIKGALGFWRANHLITDADVQQMTKALDSGADPKSLLNQIITHSEKYKELSKPVKVGENESLINPLDPEHPLYQGPMVPKDKAAIAYAATDPSKSPQERAKDALAALATADKETGTQEDQRYEKIVAARSLKQTVSPEDAAWAQAYEKRKTLVPVANFNMNAPTRADARADKSYALQTARLDKVRTPIAGQVDRLSRLTETLNQNTPQADALLAPELLTVMAGGQGSGLRMTEAEIARIVGGRSNFESLKAALNKWQLDPSKALSVTPAQRAQMRALITNVDARARGKLKQLDQASDALVNATSVDEQRRIMAETMKGLEDTPVTPTAAPGVSPSGVPRIYYDANGKPVAR